MDNDMNQCHRRPRTTVEIEMMMIKEKAIVLRIALYH